MRKIFILVMFALAVYGLQANTVDGLLVNEGNIVADSTKKTIQLKGQNLEQVMQALGASGGKSAFRLVQNITKPRILYTSNASVGVNGYRFIGSDSCVVFLNVEKCEGRLSGIDTSAYIQSGENRYKIKRLYEGGVIPTNAQTEIKWDAKKMKTLGVVFYGVPIMPSQELELVFSQKDPKALKIKTRFERKEQPTK